MKQKPILSVLQGKQHWPPPIWFMRQAGRYLPEYRAIRAKTKNFLTLCYTPELAVEVTLQPIRRYGLDAAILFSDILVIPDGLGQEVDFRENEGPILKPIQDEQSLIHLSLDRMQYKLQPVYEALSELSRVMPKQTSLIGFAGAPWTLAAYMVEGGGLRDFDKVKLFAFTQPILFEKLLDLLVEAIILHLSAQIRSGAEVVQIFDSWSGVLSAKQFMAWSVRPLTRIIQSISHDFPEIPIILFPRACGFGYAKIAQIPGLSALSLDTMVGLDWARRKLPSSLTLQGNLDPIWLVAGGTDMSAEIQHICKEMWGRSHIFNLGHGINKQTPPDHVALAVDTIRSMSA